MRGESSSIYFAGAEQSLFCRCLAAGESQPKATNLIISLILVYDY